MKNYKLLLILTVLFSSCGKDFLVEDPKANITPTSFYKTSNDLDAAVRGIALSFIHLPIIHFKIGCYYFFILQDNYFAGADFEISSTKASESKELYVLDYTPDLLGFMEWLMDGHFFEVNTKDIPLKSYTHRDAPTLWNLVFGSNKAQSDPV